MDEELPRVSTLYGNYPNPFNPMTRIAFAVPSDERVRVAIYDTGGRLVRRLVDRVFTAGSYELPWHGRNDEGENMSSGVYFYRVEIGERRYSGRMVLVK